VSKFSVKKNVVRELIPKLIAPAILLFFFIDQIFYLETETAPLLSALAALGISVMALRYKQLLLYILTLSIPLSIQISIGGSAKMSLPSEMIALLLSVFFVLKLLFGARPTRSFVFHPITLLILLDIVWLFITSLLSEMPVVSLKRFSVRVLYYIVFYYFYYELYKLDRANIKRVFFFTALGMLIPILYTLLKHYHMQFSMVGSQKISAPFYFDHTIYGACTVFMLPFLFSQTTHQKNVIKRLGYSFLTLVFVIAAWLSFSRAAWLSILVAFAIYIVIKFKIKFRTLFIISSILLFFLFLSGTKLTSVFDETKQISHTNDVTMHLKSVSNVSTDASNKERVNRWKCAIRMFADKPFFGFGPGTYQFFYGPYQVRSELTRISTFSGNKGHAHSEYLNYLSETGLPGLLIFITLVSTVCYRAYRVVISHPEEESRNLAMVLLLALISYFVHAFFNGFIEFDKAAMLVFSSIAAITALDLSQPLKKNNT